MLSMVASPASAYHRDRQAELERQMSDTQAKIAADKAQEAELLDKIAASDARRSALEERLFAIESQLMLAQIKLRRLEKKLDLATKELRYRREELQGTMAALAYWRDALQDRVAGLYMGSPVGAAEAYERATDVNELVMIEEYASSVVRSDQMLIETIEDTRVAVEDKRDQVEQVRERLSKDRAEAAEEAQRILVMRNDAIVARENIERELLYRKNLLARVRDKKAAHEKALRAMKAESDSIERFLQGAQSGQAAVQGKGGWLKWPVSGRISSGYGWRNHPIYGYRSFHTGIDIAAPQGRTVKAARKGTVLYSGYKGAYGLVVLIDHGDSVATLYAHNSKSYVRAGDVVDTLESVAAVGSTGWSTGPHLHFEVRVNGEHTDPMKWL